MGKPRVVIVMGVSGSGKSTIARLLADRNGGRFYEGDNFHSAANIAKMAAGHPLDDADRAPWLATLRHDVIDAVPPGGFAVLACSALKRSYRETLGVGKNAVALVYLEGGKSILSTRMDHRIGHYMKIDMLGSQLATLEPPGPDEGFTVGIAGTPEEIVITIETALGLAK